jgi:hypothetical protein
MFYGKRIRALEEENRELREKYYKLLDRVCKLEAEMTPYRIGAHSLFSIFNEDARPKASLREVIDGILNHLHLKVSKTHATPALTVLEKMPTVKVKA